MAPYDGASDKKLTSTRLKLLFFSYQRHVRRLSRRGVDAHEEQQDWDVNEIRSERKSPEHDEHMARKHV